MAAVSSPLALAIAVPLAGALLLVLIPRARTGWILGAALLILGLDLALVAYLATADPADLVATRYEARLQWLASPSVSVHLGLDGLSLVPLLLTPLVAGAALLAGWSEAGISTSERATTGISGSLHTPKGWNRWGLTGLRGLFPLFSRIIKFLRKKIYV